MVSQLIFKSFIHLVFIFMYGLNRFIFFSCSHVDLLTLFVEEVIFTPFYANDPFVKY